VKLFAAAVVCVLVFAGLLFAYLTFGAYWHAVTERNADVFASEYDAAYNQVGMVKEGATTIYAAQRVAALKRDETVMVLWDTYGKDYWACYIRTSMNRPGN